MPARRTTIATTAAIAAAFVAWFASGHSTPPPPAPRVLEPPSGVSVEGATPATASPPSAAAPIAGSAASTGLGPAPYLPVQGSTTAVAGYIAFPDQTWFPPLNGVEHAPQILFHRLAPFAKVVGKVVDPTGREWYVHENGVRSTTILDGAGQALGLVDLEAPVQPEVVDPPLGR